MSTVFELNVYDELRENFMKVHKRIKIFKTDKSRKLPTDKNKLNMYKTDLVTAYNKLLSYVCDFYSTVQVINRETFDNLIKESIARVKECFDILSLKYEWSDNKFQQIVLENIEPINKPANNSNNTNDHDDDNDDNDEDLNANKTSETDNDNILSDNIPETHSDNSDTSKNATMTQKPAEFMKLAASIINYKYDGTAENLEGFLADVDLVKDICEGQNTALCIKFVKAKLEKKALELIPENPTTIAEITNALTKGIPFESSLIGEGKFLALRLDRGNYSKFTKEATRLAESYRRALVKEGIPRNLASTLTVQKTVELCRKIARSEIVKSVLASARFNTPEEVVSAFITQNDIARKEKREQDNFRNSKAAPHNNRNANDKKNFNKNGNSNRNYNNRNGNNSQNDNRGNNNNNNRNNNSNNNRNNGSNNYRNNRGNNQTREHTIRLVTGNQSAPSTSGAQDNEQTYQLPI